MAQHFLDDAAVAPLLSKCVAKTMGEQVRVTLASSPELRARAFTIGHADSR